MDTLIEVYRKLDAILIKAYENPVALQQAPQPLVHLPEMIIVPLQLEPSSSLTTAAPVIEGPPQTVVVRERWGPLLLLLLH